MSNMNTSNLPQLVKTIFSKLNNVFTYLVLLTALPLTSSAHEVYVLTPEEVEALEKLPPISFLDILTANINDTIIWGLIVGLIIVSVFIISISVKLEDRFDKYLVKLKRFAPFIARVTVGLGFLTCAYHNALFGPELPFPSIYGQWSLLVQITFAVLGVFMILGLYSRIAGLTSLALFAIAFFREGSYMFTYVNYMTEFLVLILIGGHKYTVADTKHVWWKITKTLNYLAVKYGEFAFLILRVGFGTSLIYAAVYAKILHNQLSIAVVNEFDLISVFGFPAEFIVFGAGIIEILLGIFFILGIEIRFTAIVLNIFLTLSLFYFGEAVWPHIILIGIPIAFFCYGYDKYSLEGYFFKKGNREPIF